MILLLWSLQNIFFERIYRQKKEKQTSTAMSSAITTLADGGSSMNESLQNIAAYYDVCILVTDRDLHTVASVESSPRCSIHSMNYLQLSALYSSAIAKGGTYTVYETLHESFPAPPPGIGKSMTPPETETELENKSMIMVSVISSDTGDQNVFFVNSILSPISETNSAIRSILVWISIVIFFLSVIISFIVSRSIARPISAITSEARNLSGGVFMPQAVDSDWCEEVHELSETLKAVGDELSITEKLRQELVANISHDLRTPLTLISGTAEMMKDFDDERTDENLNIIISESNRMNRLLKDAMDLSKIQSNTEPVDPKPFDLTSLLRGIASNHAGAAENEDYTVTFACDSTINALGNGVLIARVVENLVSNAINYLGDGDRVEIIQFREADGRHVRVEVRDNGEGISEEDLPHLFERYYRSKANHKRSSDGSGLGLSIVKSILDAHGSAYGVSSTPGAGSVFWFNLETAE